jgi:hypothetical protein
MNEDQNIRAQALAVAAQMRPGARIPVVIEAAERLAEWIRTGELPAPAPGQMD